MGLRICGYWPGLCSKSLGFRKDAETMKKVVIFGATGNVGSYLTHYAKGFFLRNAVMRWWR